MLRPLHSLALVPLLGACPDQTPTPELPPVYARAERLLPAAADFLLGVDLAGVLASETFRQLAPKLREDPILLRWHDVVHDCGVDPLLARATLLAGTNGHEVVVVLIGPDLGDVARLRCIADEMAAQDRGRAPFSVHDREHAGLVADHDIVATVADERTIVFTTRGWSVAVHGLAEAHEDPAPPVSRPQFARADRSADLWFAGRLPRPFKLTEEPPTAQTIVGRLDVGDNLHGDLLLGFEEATHVAQVRDEIADLEAHAQHLAQFVGFDKKTDVLALTMNGDELRVALALSPRFVTELATGFARTALRPTPDPRQFLALGGRHTFGNYTGWFAYRKPSSGLFAPSESPCELSWADPEDMFVQSVERNELLLVAVREGVAEVRCADRDVPLAVRAATTMEIGYAVSPGFIQVETHDQFSLGVDLFDHEGYRLEVGTRSEVEWSIKGVLRPSHNDSAAILGLNPYIDGRNTFKASAAGEGAVRARLGTLQAQAIVVAVDATP